MTQKRGGSVMKKALVLFMAVLMVFAYPKTISYSKNNYKYLCEQIQVN